MIKDKEGNPLQVFHHPILKWCPRCENETNWRWNEEEITISWMKIHISKGNLVCMGCGFDIDPIKLGVKEMAAWLQDPANYTVVNRREKAKAGD